MNILFIHQNMPGQFKHLAPFLAGNPDNHVVFITQRIDVELPGVRRVVYRPPRPPRNDQHPYLGLTEAAVLNGQEVLRACLIPTPTDQYRCAQSRIPIEMMRHG